MRFLAKHSRRKESLHCCPVLYSGRSRKHPRYQSNHPVPVVVAVNMMDLVRRNGDQIDARKLSDALGCQVVEISALKGEGGVEAAELAAKMAQQKRAAELPHVFTGSVEHAIAHIEESIQGMVDDRYQRISHALWI